MTDQPSKPINKDPKDYRRQQLIDATIRTISKFGLSKTTISKVTSSANLSSGIVGFYFKSKEQLLLGTLEYIDDEYNVIMEAVFEKKGSPESIICDFINASFNDRLCDLDKIAVWQAFSGESRAREEYMKICGDHDDAFHQSLLNQIHLLCNHYPNTYPAAITQALRGLVDSYWLNYLFTPTRFDREEAKLSCLEFLSSVFPAHFDDQSVESAAIEVDGSASSALLAPWTYQDPEFLELEQSALFRENWLLVGHVNDVAEPNSYLTFDAMGERVLILCDRDRTIRAFHNVCRHRGAKLLDGAKGRCANVISCPFHGWTYQLDGTLIGVPEEQSFSGLEKSHNGLLPLDSEIWQGFIFVRFAQSGSSVATMLAPIEPLIKQYRLDEIQPIDDSYYAESRPYNWKVIHDIDNEGYHVPKGHPTLQQLYGAQYKDEFVQDIAVSRAKLNDAPGTLWSVRHYQNLLPHFDHLDPENQRLWLYIGIFPNTVIGLYPDSVEFYMTLPVSPTETIYRGASYALVDNRRTARAARYLCQRINRITDKEDESFVRGMQEGLQSSVFGQRHLSSLEHGVQHFHKRIQSILPVATLPRHPGVGKVANTNNKMST